MEKVGLIFGMGGQDSWYLTKHLHSKGYKVIGVVRRSSQPRDYLDELVKEGLTLVEGDITDYSSVEQIITEYKPSHIYNLAAQSHVATSFKQPIYTTEVNYKGVLNILEVIRTHLPFTHFYQASTSEMFGKRVSTLAERAPHGYEPSQEEYENTFQDEETPFEPQSPYSIAKLAAHELVRLYRESYNLFACSGILFNHESEHRGSQFLTRKVTRYVGKLVNWLSDEGYIWNSEYSSYTFKVNGDSTEDTNFTGNNDTYGDFLKRQESRDKILSYPKLKLGNLDACRDWSHAEDLTEVMVMMLEAETANDYVVGSGETHTVREFVETAFNEIGQKWEDWVEIDPSLVRPAEVDYLRARPEKVKKELGWTPKNSFKDLVSRMVKYDIEQAKKNA